MDIVQYISPFEYIGSSIGKINDNFQNLQELPVTLSAKYIQIDNFITSLRSQLVTDTAIVSGNASVRDTFRAEGPVVLGSDTRAGEDVIIYSWPIYLPNATQTARALVFGGLTTGTTTNLYQTSFLSTPTLQTDGNVRILGNATFGDAVAETVTISGGNLFLSNATDTNNALRFGTTTHANLYRNGPELLRTDGSFLVTRNVNVSGSVQSVEDVNTTRNLNVSGVAQIQNTLTQNVNVSAALQIANTVRVDLPATGDTDNVVVERATTALATRAINSKVWNTGVTFVDGTGTANTIPKWSDTDTVTNSNITDSGTAIGLVGSASITLNGPLILKSGINAGTAVLVGGTVTVNNTACTTSSIVIVTLRVANTTNNTVHYRATPGSGSFTITALNNTGALNNADISTLSWILVNTVA
jgi:hypothetical protein